MPTYDYACAGCGPFEALRPMARRDEATACPGCGQDADRLFGAVAAQVGAAGTGAARHRLITRQERALADGAYRRMRHPMSCGCCR